MATWPTGSKASTANLDAGTDSPRLARPDIKQNVDNVNAIVDMFNIDSPTADQILKYNTSNARFELAADATGTAVSATTFVGDDSTGTAVNAGETFKIAGGTNITTAVSGDTLTITGPTLTSYLTSSDISSFITASSSDALTNKTGVISQWTNDSAYITNNGNGDLTISGSTIASSSNSNITLTPNGSGKVVLSGIQYPIVNGSDGQVLTTNGLGAASWATASGGSTVTVFSISIVSGTVISGFTYRAALTELYDTGSIDIVSDGFSLPAGVYLVLANGNLSGHYSGACSVYNTTDSAELVAMDRNPGGSLRASGGAVLNYSTLGGGAFTLSDTTAIEIRHTKSGSDGDMNGDITFIKIS